MIEKNSNYDDLKKKMKELETELSLLGREPKPMMSQNFASRIKLFK